MRRSFGALLALLAGCLGTERTATVIDAVTPTTAIEVPEFKLAITGHGFGLEGVTYHVGEQQGVASRATGLRVEIRKRNGTIAPEISRITTTLVSPTTLSVTVGLRVPLPADTYDLLLFGQEGGEAIAGKQPAFEVAGVAPSPDAGVSARDASLGGSDASGPSPDAGDAADAGALVTGDSGLGPFVPGPGFRRAIILTNNSGSPSTPGITARVPVPHAAMVAAGQSTPTADDLAVYLGAAPVPFQVQDRALIGTDRLELVVQLPTPVAAGVSTDLPLALYSDPIAGAGVVGTDAVYVYAERFDAELPAFEAGRRDLWNDRWMQSCADRLAPGRSLSRCVTDTDPTVTRKTLASPAITGMGDVLAVNERYEVEYFLGGSMQSVNDLVYFAWGPDNEDWTTTTLPPETDFDPSFPPTALLSFVEVNSTRRTVVGHRLPTLEIPFTRVRVRIAPPIRSPHLHFRFLSTDATVNVNTRVGLDDLTVRRALEPELRVSLGPVEARQ